MPTWWKGRHDRFKIYFLFEKSVGSSPTVGIFGGIE